MTAEKEKKLVAEMRRKLASYRAQLMLMREIAPFDEAERFREDWVEPLERLIARLEKESEATSSSNTASPTGL